MLGGLRAMTAGLGKHIVDQPRDGPIALLKGRTQDAANALTGDSRAGIEAE